MTETARDALMVAEKHLKAAHRAIKTARRIGIPSGTADAEAERWEDDLDAMLAEVDDLTLDLLDEEE